MPTQDTETIQSLRRDVALQIARYVLRRGKSQVSAAAQLGIPQPTLSKIMGGKVDESSLELLVRIAVRAGLSLVMQTGKSPEEAGAHLSGVDAPEPTRTRSRLSDEAREALADSARRLTPEQRLEAQFQHSKLVTSLHRAGERASRRA